MSDLMLHLPDYWHLWAVAAMIGLIALNYGTQFVSPALRLKTSLSQVNAHLAALSQQAPGTHIDLAQLKDEVMTSPALQHAWQQYASTLQAQWQAADAGPLGAARQRVGHLSRAFFAHMDVASNGHRLDLSNLEQLAQNDPSLGKLWAEYNQAVEELQRLEMSTPSTTAQWQAHTHAEHYFTEQALVDSPLQSNFYKHTPGILTGVEADAKRWIGEGCLFTAVGADVGLLARATDALAAKFKS